MSQLLGATALDLNTVVDTAARFVTTEYASLTDRNVSKDVSGALTAWLTKTFAAIK